MTFAAVRIVRDAARSLRLELSEMRLSGGRASGCAMTAAAVTLSVMVTLALALPDAWWAGISAFVSTRATAPASIERGVLRILGTIGGAAVSLLLCPWLAGDAVTLTLVLFAVSTVGVLGFLVSPHGYAWLLSAITADMVLLALLSDPLSAVSVAANRTAEVTIGTVAAVLVVLVLAPDADAAPAAPAPGWSDLLGAQWPAVQHALQAGAGVMLVPVVWNWLELPSLSQTAITVAAVMAVPALSQDTEKNRQTVTERALHRVFGCLVRRSGRAGVPRAAGGQPAGLAGDADRRCLGRRACAGQHTRRRLCRHASGGGVHPDAGAGGRAAGKHPARNRPLRRGHRRAADPAGGVGAERSVNGSREVAANLNTATRCPSPSSCRVALTAEWCHWRDSQTSTRRLRDLPHSLLLQATGTRNARPVGITEETPRSRSMFATARARSCESFRLSYHLPTSSVKPST